jgi:hypothetical protein
MRSVSRVLVLGMLGSACGSSPEASEPEVSESGGGERREQAAEDSLAVTGLRGTLSQEEIKRALEPRMPKFGRCVQKRSGEVEWLAGSLELSFRVAVDGSVGNVFPTRSSMGDRATEQCALDVARGTRFPQPHGGEAEFTWSFEVPLDGEIREPVSWGAAEAGEQLAAHGSEITAQCGGGSYAITAYVDTEGKVVSAGAASAAEEAAGQLDCVAEAVRTWTFASPGSYPAKIQFSIE